MNRSRLAASLVILLFSTLLMAQSRNIPPVSTVVALLPKALEAKTATAGQDFVLITLTDVVVNGETIVPKGSEVVGKITEVVAKGKDEAKCMLAIRIDKAVTKKGQEITLQAIIAAIESPRDNSLSSDPQYGMMHSNEPKMAGGGPGTVANTGGLSASSKSASTAAVATAELKGRMDESLLLDENSQGAIGFEDLSLSWSLTVPPPLTLFASKAKNIKLKAGTQMLLRMAEPRLAR